jgi:hypothetical protein
MKTKEENMENITKNRFLQLAKISRKVENHGFSLTTKVLGKVYKLDTKKEPLTREEYLYNIKDLIVSSFEKDEDFNELIDRLGGSK